MRWFALVVVGVLIAPFAVAAIPQDDAGTGRDSPADASFVPDVDAPGFSGTVDAESGDALDWYRLDVPFGHGVHLEVASDATPVHLILQNNTNVGLQERATIYGAIYEHSEPMAGDFVTPEGTAFVRVGSVERTGNYQIQLAYFPLADVSVDGLYVDVRPDRISDVAGSGVSRMIEVDVANKGLAVASGVRVEFWVHQTMASRLVAVQTVTLHPGAERHLVVAWDTWGQVGSATVEVRALVPLDLNPRDNVASVTSDVLLATPVLGFDLLNYNLSFAGVRYDWEGAKVYFDVDVVTPLGWGPAPSVHGHASERDGAGFCFNPAGPPAC